MMLGGVAFSGRQERERERGGREEGLMAVLAYTCGMPATRLTLADERTSWPGSSFIVKFREEVTGRMMRLFRCRIGLRKLIEETQNVYSDGLILSI